MSVINNLQPKKPNKAFVELKKSDKHDSAQLRTQRRMFDKVRVFPCTVIQLSLSEDDVMAVAHYYPEVPLEQTELDNLYSDLSSMAAPLLSGIRLPDQIIAIRSPNAVTASVIGPTDSVSFHAEPSTEPLEQGEPFFKYDPANSKEIGPVYFVNMSSKQLKLTVSAADNHSSDANAVILQPTGLDSGDSFSRYVLTLNGSAGEIRSCIYPEADLKIDRKENGWYDVCVPAGKASLECSAYDSNELLRVSICELEKRDTNGPRYSFYLRKTDHDYNHKDDYNTWLRPIYLINVGDPCRLKRVDCPNTDAITMEKGTMIVCPLTYEPYTDEDFSRMEQEMLSSPEVQSAADEWAWDNIWRPRFLEYAAQFKDDELNLLNNTPNWIIEERTKELVQEYGYKEVQAQEDAQKLAKGLEQYYYQVIYDMVRDKWIGWKTLDLMEKGRSEEQAHMEAELTFQKLVIGDNAEPHYATYEEEPCELTRKIKERCYKAASAQSYSNEEKNILNRICEEVVDFANDLDEDDDGFFPFHELKMKLNRMGKNEKRGINIKEEEAEFLKSIEEYHAYYIE